MAFKNYVYTQDLKAYSPLIMKDLYATQTDYSPQISLAGQLVVIDLQGHDIDTRLICVPSDLQTVYNPSDANEPMTYSDITSSISTAHTDKGTANYGFNSYKRFGVDVASFNSSGSVTFTLQGTNESSADEITETDWVDIISIPFTSASLTGEYVTTFEKEYRWVRYTVMAQDGAQMRYSAWTNDTTIDQFVITKTFVLLMTDMVERENDMWDMRRKQFEKWYDSLIGGAKYLIDMNDSGKPDVGDTEVSTGTLKFY